MNSYVFPCSKRAGSYFIQIPTVWSEKATDSEYFSTSRYQSPKAVQKHTLKRNSRIFMATCELH
jgi:hypothetical protein